MQGSHERNVRSVVNLSEALRVVQTESFDAALVDANLAGLKVDELAAALADRAIPFAFVTGYARENLPQAFLHVPVIAKPYQHEQLKEVMRTLLASASTLPATPSDD